MSKIGELNKRPFQTRSEMKKEFRDALSGLLKACYNNNLQHTNGTGLKEAMQKAEECLRNNNN